MDVPQLRSIHIKGYKSIKDQEISLNPLNVLIGQNGAGKSNFISLFKLLRNIIEGKLKNFSLKVGAESLLYYGGKETSNISLDLNLFPNYYHLVLQPALSNDSLFVGYEAHDFKSEERDQPFSAILGTPDEESKLSKVEKIDPIARNIFHTIKDWRVYHFHDSSETAGVKKYAALSDYKFLFEDASNIAPFLFILKKTEEAYYDRIVKTIQLVIPFFKDFVLDPNPLNPENIRLEWNDVYSDKTFTAHDLSDGSLRFICMATLLLQKTLPGIIIFDEPELGLHPSAIYILASLLKKASKRSQVIVATQSVTLVNEFEPEDILVVEKDMAETVFKRLDVENLQSWLEEYTLGELWDKNVIGGKP